MSTLIVIISLITGPLSIKCGVFDQLSIILYKSLKSLIYFKKIFTFESIKWILGFKDEENSAHFLIV